jgi:hypothetical protein
VRAEGARRTPRWIGGSPTLVRKNLLRDCSFSLKALPRASARRRPRRLRRQPPKQPPDAAPDRRRAAGTTNSASPRQRARATHAPSWLATADATQTPGHAAAVTPANSEPCAPVSALAVIHGRIVVHPNCVPPAGVRTVLHPEHARGRLSRRSWRNRRGPAGRNLVAT